MQFRFIRFEYANSDTYEGWWNDALQCPHGLGIYTWGSGIKYEGSWSNGRKHGYGVQTYPSGDRYEGGWKDGQWHGYGKLIRPNVGRTYEGGFAAGQEYGYARIHRLPQIPEIMKVG